MKHFYIEYATYINEKKKKMKKGIRERRDEYTRVRLPNDRMVRKAVCLFR